MKAYILFFILAYNTLFPQVQAQSNPWQQRVEYDMEITLDVNTHRMTGKQKLIYYNHSPDTLRRIYYHLYFNAFQPGSMMDVRSRNISDPDKRVMARIAKLKKDEIGYQHIISFKQNGIPIDYKIYGTILEATLNEELHPDKNTVLDMEFQAQVPLQIRRSGRDNKEGIAYSMTQWYPKIAEYDYQGWHAYPYIGREFHGVWGDYNVSITLDSKFTVAGTGVLQNPNEIGHGYEDEGIAIKNKNKQQLTWHFSAPDVHDFAWAADPDYEHIRTQVPDGPELHFFYQKNKKTVRQWKNMKPYAVQHFQYMNRHYGVYPYPSYSIIQGGDGGMEYPMCTLILGEGKFESLISLMAHEVSHSWFQGVLASNEALYPWMDEGFTSFASHEALMPLLNNKKLHEGSYTSYFNWIDTEDQEPMSTHSDRYNTNKGYKVAAYSMGAILLHQLKYLIGNETFYSGMKRYYNTWKMRHPEPNDFIRIMEKESGMQLHWYLQYWVYSIKHIDYGIDNLQPIGTSTEVSLRKIGDFPMPIDLLVTYKDGSKELFYIPMNEMLKNKPIEDIHIKRSDLKTWNWVNPIYTFKISRTLSDIEQIEIDPSFRMADINRKNNVFRAQ